MLTMLPPPAAIIAFASARRERNAPVRLVAITRSNSAVVISVIGPPVPVPAEFTASWSAPKRSTVAATAASTEASSVTSQGTHAARSPSRLAASRSVSSRRAQIITRPPAFTISSAQPKPIPVAPAVTNATFPSRLAIRDPPVERTLPDQALQLRERAARVVLDEHGVHAEPARRRDVAGEVVEEHRVFGRDAAELAQREREDRRIGLAHADLARVDHRVEQLGERDHRAPALRELARVVGH